MSLVLLLVAIFLALWAAFVSAGWVTFGTYGVLLGFAIACFAASFLPWPNYFRR